MEVDPDDTQITYSTSDLQVVCFIKGGNSYEFSFLTINGNKTILAKEARQALESMFPTCPVFKDPHRHFSYSMCKIKDALCNIPLKGRTKREDKKKCIPDLADS